MIQAREFVFNYLIHEEPDGTVMYTASSDNCDYHLPETSGVTRGYMALAGFMFEPDVNDPSKTNAKMMVELDLKGSIPEFALKKALKDQGIQIVKLRQTVKKFNEMFPSKP